MSILLYAKLCRIVMGSYSVRLSVSMTLSLGVDIASSYWCHCCYGLVIVFTIVINYDKRIDLYKSSNQEIKLISSLINGSGKFEP
jgi:hypothetical protein